MERIARYSRQKKGAGAMVDFLDHLRQDNPDKSVHKTFSELRNCANYLLFHDYYTVDELRLAAARTCKKHMLCPFCAGRRAAKFVEKSVTKVEEVMNSEGAFKPALVTLTVKNGVDPKERYTHLQKAFRTLQERRRDYLKKGRGWTELVKISGAIYANEITYSQKTDFHPHIHMFSLLNEWIDRDRLIDEWQSVTGDSWSIDIRRVKPQPNGGGLDIRGAIEETLKYTVKFEDRSPEITWQVYQALKGKRMIGSFGNLHGVKVPDNLLDDLLEGLPYLERLYQFKSGSYQLKSVRDPTERG